MKNCAFLALFLLWSAAIFAQIIQEKHSRVEIDLAGKDIATLTRLGVETDHGIFAPGRSLVADLSASEIMLVKNAGFHTKTLIEDLKQDYLQRLQNPVASQREAGCNLSGVTPYPLPENYTYGSMGGYHTLSEMMEVLDDMRAKFPDLITARADCSDTIETWEGRKIQYVKISKNANVDEPEPEVLYTALHHAREPNGASQMLFYMWYLLENYPADPEVKYILDNAELYFVPCINPDGYVYNETTDPQGGGFWRKNLRDNGDGTFGVDLNRNYGYFWGNDDNGSSPDPGSATYRGPAAFSEPESRTIRDFVQAHDFVFALNYHTFSNLLIYPWAYNNELADPSLAHFGKLLTRENHYKNGTAIETVGYNVNGNSDDWMFAEKNVHSFTPEVGRTGFWPQPDEIEDLNRENMWQNLATALCALQFGEAKDLSPNYFSTTAPKIDLEVTRHGYRDGAFSLTLSPLTGNVQVNGSNTQTITLQQFETQQRSFELNLQPGIQVGDKFSLLLQFSNGAFTRTDTLHKTYGGKTFSLYTENGDNLNDWINTEGWGRTQTTYVSAPFSVTDSPNGNYASDADKEITMSNPGVSIPANAQQPQLRFWAKWDLEQNYDFVQARAVSGNFSQALCGQYTIPGPNFFDNEPVFNGLKAEWVEECMDLSDFIGQSVRIRFRLTSDGEVEYDGFYFDDLRIEYTDPTLLRTVIIPIDGFRLRQNEPNPAAGFTLVGWENEGQLQGEAQLVVFNNLGKKMASTSINLSDQSQVQLDTRSWPAGIYTYFLQSAQSQSQPMKMTVVR